MQNQNPIKVEFLNSPKIEPNFRYKRCIYSLYILKCATPKYYLEEDMRVRITFEDGKKILIIVKKGFECDLASIPRIAWGLYPPDGNYRYASVLHDILYQTESFNREICDTIFKLAMSNNVPNSVKNLFYYAVRAGGYFAYRNTKEDIKKAKEYILVGEMI